MYIPKKCVSSDPPKNYVSSDPPKKYVTSDLLAELTKCVSPKDMLAQVLPVSTVSASVSGRHTIHPGTMIQSYNLSTNNDTIKNLSANNCTIFT